MPVAGDHCVGIVSMNDIDGGSERHASVVGGVLWCSLERNWNWSIPLNM